MPEQRQEDETSPLLGRHPRDAPSSRWSLSFYQAQSLHTLVMLFSICCFCLTGASAFINVPLTRLIEDNLCRRDVEDVQWQGSPIDEGLCKTDQIQSKLAYLNSSLSVVESVVGIIAAFPFGVLADIVGRKPIVYLSAGGSLLALAWILAVLDLPEMIPIQFILAGPLFNVIGGGSTVLVASLYSMVSDVVEGKDRASVFFFMAFASLLGAAVSPALSSRFMEAFSPWAAVLLGFFAVPVGVSVLAFIPETFPQSKRESFPKDDPAGPERPRRNTFLSHLSHSILLLEASIAMLRSPSIVLILATFLTQTPEVIATSQSFVQYVSKRFDWPLATAGYLLTIKGIMNMIVLLLMLPLLSKLLIHGRHPGAKDLVLARFSAAFAAAGALLMAASQMGVVVSGLALHSLGAGLAPLCRSLATSYLAPQDTSKINTLIGIVGTVGTLFATPALAWLFETGMKLKGAWLGLPYFGLAALFALCLLGLFFVSALRREDAEDGYDETGEVPRGDPLSTRGDLDQNA